jgi:hypothetical protein
MSYETPGKQRPTMTASRRLGTFSVAGQFLRQATEDEGANLFHRMIVIRAEPEWQSDRTRYLAIHPDFAMLPEGMMAPEYSAVFNAGEIYPKWIAQDAS